MTESSSSSSKPIHTSDTFRPLLKKLTLSASLPSHNSTYPPKKPGSNLTSDELLLLFQHLSDPNFTSSHSNHSQIGAALTSLRLTGQDSNSKSLSIASNVFLNCANKVEIPQEQQQRDVKSKLNGNQNQEDQGGDENVDRREFEIQQEIEDYNGSLDLVGTGGDGHDTFNVSTTAAMVASGVKGVRICKVSLLSVVVGPSHGRRTSCEEGFYGKRCFDLFEERDLQKVNKIRKQLLFC